MKEIGFVIPVFNSESTLRTLFSRIKKIVAAHSYSYQIVFINDHSLDSSWQILRELKKEDPENITIINLSRNSGQHNAILCGLHFCDARLIVTLDDDLQTPPEEATKLINEINDKKQDVVYGIYSEKKHSLFRNFGSFIIQRVFSFVFKSNGSISSFRVFTSALKERLLKYKTSFTFIDGFIHWETIKIGRIAVDHQERTIGKSGYNWQKLLSLTLNLFFNFTTLPLSLIIWLGILCSSGSFALGVIFIIRKIIYDVPVGYTSIIVAILFSTGLLLIVIGIIGEYMKRLYLSFLNAPQYSIEEVDK